MSHKQEHIDKIFREKLKKASSPTPEFAWEKLEKDLDSGLQKKRIILYRKIIAVAALIIILLGSGLYLLLQNNDNEAIQQISSAEKDSTFKPTLIENQSKKTPIIIPNENTLAHNQTETKSDQTIIIEPEPVNTTEESKSIIRSNINLMYAQPILTKSVEKPILSPLTILRRDLDKLKAAILNGNLNLNDYLGIPDNTLIADAGETKKSRNKWSLGGGFSPAYQNNNTGIFSQKMYDNVYGPESALTNANQSENTVITYTGGVNVSYQLSDRWSIQSGVNYLQQGHKIENFSVVENSYGGSSNFESYSSNGIIDIKDETLNSNVDAVQNVILDFAQNEYYYDSYLLQSFEFLEIPLIFRYKFIDKKLSMFLLSGINTNLMVGNNVFLGNDRNKNVGETSDVNKLIYSSLFGLSIEYPLLKNLLFNISPAVKYQINPINSDTGGYFGSSIFDFKTGLVYTFE